jgi:hypothetical protein
LEEWRGSSHKALRHPKLQALAANLNNLVIPKHAESARGTCCPLKRQWRPSAAALPMESSLRPPAGVCCQPSGYRRTLVTPGNPLWFLDLVSLLSQPAPDPAPEPVKVNLIPVREWKRHWNVSRLLRPPVKRHRRRRRRRLISRIRRHISRISDKQYMFFGVAALLIAVLLIVTAPAPD